MRGLYGVGYQVPRRKASLLDVFKAQGKFSFKGDFAVLP